MSAETVLPRAFCSFAAVAAAAAAVATAVAAAFCCCVFLLRLVGGVLPACCCRRAAGRWRASRRSARARAPCRLLFGTARNRVRSCRRRRRFMRRQETRRLAAACGRRLLKNTPSAATCYAMLTRLVLVVWCGCKFSCFLRYFFRVLAGESVII